MHIGLISNEGRRPTRRVALTMLLWLSCVGIVSLITWHSNSPHDPTQAFTIKSKGKGANRLERPVVYEINTAAWLFELSSKYSSPFTLGNTLVRRELGALKENYTGINVIWFMGIWQKGNAGLQHDRNDPSLLSDFASILPGFTMEDIIGSPYAVQDYTINKDLGTVEDFLAIRSYLQSIGIKVMLDFVPNHTALDNDWAVNHPDFYINAVDAASCTTNCVTINNHYLYIGGDTYQSGWTDTIQLNYWNVNTRSAQIDNLRMIASLADYIRCDMAMDILNDEISHAWGPKLSATGYNRPTTEFWGDAIAAVQASYPDTAFIAEAYNYGITPTPELDLLRDLGFSFVYEKTILDIMVGISQSTKSTTDLVNYLSSHGQNYYSKACFFVENHDDNRAAGLNLLGSVDKAVAAAVLVSTLPGMKLYYHGQFEGFTNKLDVHLRKTKDTGMELTLQNIATEEKFVRLLSIIDEKVFTSGEWKLQPVVNDRRADSLIAYTYSLQDAECSLASSCARRLVVVNLTGSTGSGSIVLSDAIGPSGDITQDYEITELISNQQYLRNPSILRTSGIYVIIDPHRYQVFTY